MRQVNSKIQEIIDKICVNSFTENDVGMLFIIWLRPFFENNKDDIMLDLSNFVAHNEGRDMGISFNYVNSFVENFLNVSEKGGTIKGSTLFTKNDVLKRLVFTLKSIKVSFEENDLLNKKDTIINCLKKLVDDIEFKIRDPRVVKCYTSYKGEDILFCFQANLFGPLIKMSPGASVCSNLFR